VDTEHIAEWVVGHYPRRRYPAVFIGSSSGALIHLAALAGVPWLPQTLLVPVRHDGLDPDDPQASMAALSTARDTFTRNNPGVVLHHMHDANQDRLMIRRMAYFRYKYRTLPRAYARFLRDHLAPGGSVISAECTEHWPTTQAGERQVFQHGAVGGATVEEIQHGSARVRDFLATQGSSYTRWTPPTIDGESPEAEWGFEPALLDDLAQACAGQDRRLLRLSFPHAQTLSAPVSEAYRDWYTECGVAADRLVAGCFLLFEPRLPLRLGLVPQWTVFCTEPARAELRLYLDQAKPYREVHIGLFSHGTCSIGLAGADRWAELGTLLGVDRAVFPQDFASNGRFHRALAALPPTEGAPVPEAGWDWVHRRLRDRLEPPVALAAA